MRSQGKQFGVEQNARQTSTPAASPSAQTMVPTGEYSFPLKREEFLFVTSPFGMRNDPMGSGTQQMLCYAIFNITWHMLSINLCNLCCSYSWYLIS